MNLLTRWGPFKTHWHPINELEGMEHWLVPFFVSVRQAAVTLKGEVLDAVSKHAAEKAAAGVSGVKSVINRLQVVDRLPPQKLNNLEVVR